MGRKKKVKPNENPEVEQLQTNSETETPLETQPEGGNVDVSWDSGSSSENRTEENPQSQTEIAANIDAIMSGFGDESETLSTEPVNTDEVKKRGRKSKKDEQPVAKIPGKLFLKVHAKLAVTVMTIADKYISKQPIPPQYIHALELTKEDLEDEDLIHAANECCKALKIESNPFAAFYVTFGTMVLSNYMTVRTLVTQQMKEQNNAVG